MNTRKLIVLPLVLMLTGCADTSRVDNLIAAQETTEAASAEETYIAITEADTTVSAAAPEPEVELVNTSNGEYDVDLTILNSTMVYAQCYDMVYNADNYKGKLVRVHGPFAYYQDPETGKEYFAVLISDATACCSQGIEFRLAADAVYPDDYPETGTEITIHGNFDSYEENGSPYVQLLEAVIEPEETE